MPCKASLVQIELNTGFRMRIKFQFNFKDINRVRIPEILKTGGMFYSDPDIHHKTFFCITSRVFILTVAVRKYRHSRHSKLPLIPGIRLQLLHLVCLHFYAIHNQTLHAE